MTSSVRVEEYCLVRYTCILTSRVPVCSQSRQYAARAEGGGGKRISQTEFTEKAWQAIVSAPDIAKNYSQQIVETEHLLKGLLEQPNGLARRIVSKAGSDPSRLLDKTEAFIRQQPRVTGESGQVRPHPLSASHHQPLHLLCLLGAKPTSGN